MRKLFLFVGLFLSAVAAIAQAAMPPFWNNIQAFKKRDSAQMPPKNAILFVGSSSFTKWTDVQDYFPGYPIINRGFGGSSLPDLIRYADDVIFPYKPKQVLIYGGDNDLASSDTVTAQTVYARFVTLFTMIRERLPKTAIAFVAIKPSPSRVHLMPKAEAANALVKAFLQTRRRTAFIDVYRPMLQPDGKPKPEIFESDSLHMNSSGYKIWQAQIQPVLRK